MVAAKTSQTKIILNNYATLLSKIRKCITQAQTNIVQNVTRQKVVMSWKLGKIIDEDLLRNDGSGYGEHLFAKLEQDTALKKRALYQMHSFYKTYPKLPKDDSSLNWSHYRTLSGIKKSDERKYLENLTRENSWDSDRLQLEVVNTNKASKGKVQNSAQKNSSEKKLNPTRGKLFSYSLTKVVGSDKTYFDLGFNVFRVAKEELSQNLHQEAKKQNLVVEVSKKNKSHSVKKSSLKPRNLNAYKAYLERVVDGDTLHVTIDLGFETFHREIIRLKGIDSPELNTADGKKSSKILSSLLENIPFLIVKTTGKDIYGRYVADVFLPERLENDLQKVADEGIYLNQLLLDKGSAVRMVV